MVELLRHAHETIIGSRASGLRRFLTSDEPDRSIANMSRSLSVVGATVLLLVGASARAGKPRIAVAAMAGDNAPAELREKVAQAVAAGLAASGADVRTEPAVVAYVIRGKVEREGRNYTLQLEIVDSKT